MNYKLLSEIITQLEIFEKTKQNHFNSNVEEFTDWLIQQKSLDNSNEDKKLSETVSMSLQGDIHARITQLIFLMNRYLKFYIKKGFEGTELTAADDFGFIATLFLEGNLQKNELIEKNTMEFSSGVEVIRRLEKNGLIESLQDVKDKRAKIVMLTEIGKTVFHSIMPVMAQIGKIATANLNEEEKMLLFGLLQKLNSFHNPIFHQAKKENINELYAIYMNDVKSDAG